MKEKTIELNKANLYSILATLISIPAVTIPYYLCYGINRDDFSSGYFLLALLVLIVLHELTHGIFFALYAKSGFKSISFGVKWKYLAPYCHCSEAVKAKHYGVAVLMPTLLLGILPLIAGFAIGNFTTTFVGLIMTLSGMGDLMVFKLLMEVPADAFVTDHPDKAGFLYECRKD